MQLTWKWILAVLIIASVLGGTVYSTINVTSRRIPAYGSIASVENTAAYIEYISETIQDLPDEIFSKPEEDVPDLKNDFSDLFDDALENINESNCEGAIEKLDRIKQKIYEEIMESDERQEIISMINNLITYLETLL